MKFLQLLALLAIRFPYRVFFQSIEDNRLAIKEKHGSWLNIAENELSSMTRQCLKDRKMTDIDMLEKETSAWATNSNDKQRGVNWQFKVEDARRKLRSLYPNI